VVCPLFTSVAAKQSGTSGLTPDDTEEYCRVGTDSFVGWAASQDSGDPDTSNISNVVSPCGLIAYSYFNDSFRLIEVDKNGSQISVPKQTSEDISWKSDRDVKFKNAGDGSTGNNFLGFQYEKARARPFAESLTAKAATEPIASPPSPGD